MELKLNKIHHTKATVEVLIVPYGIETYLIQVAATKPNFVLIVPYGIETLIRAWSIEHSPMC